MKKRKRKVGKIFYIKPILILIPHIEEEILNAISTRVINIIAKDLEDVTNQTRSFSYDTQK